MYSPDAALRYTYGGVLLLAVVTLGPHYFLQGTGGWKAPTAEHLRCLSPIPAVMHLVGHTGVGAKGLIAGEHVTARCVWYGIAATGLFAGLTLARLNHRLFDRAHSQGLITDERSWVIRTIRRMFFVVDPQRRKLAIAPLINPVMVKEFRCRGFGRMLDALRAQAVNEHHWRDLGDQVEKGPFPPPKTEVEVRLLSREQGNRGLGGRGPCAVPGQGIPGLRDVDKPGRENVPRCEDRKGHIAGSIYRPVAAGDLVASKGTVFRRSRVQLDRVLRNHAEAKVSDQMLAEADRKR